MKSRKPLTRKTPLVSKILPRRELGPPTRSPLPKRRAGKRRTLAVHSAAWLDAVRGIPCCVRCGKFGVEAAHADIDKGMSQKTDDCTACALCAACHFELGNGSKLSRDERRAEMDRCMRLTIIMLWRAGRLAVVPPNPDQWDNEEAA